MLLEGTVDKIVNLISVVMIEGTNDGVMIEGTIGEVVIDEMIHDDDFI